MKKNINLILVIIWMIIIFVFSSFDATTSGSQSGTFVNIIANIFKITNIDIITFIIRKSAHIMEYLILGLLVTNYLKNIVNKYLIISLLICLLYSISDEIHQLFILGRSGQISDVLVDMIGVFIGTFLCHIIIKKKAITK